MFLLLRLSTQDSAAESIFPGFPLSYHLQGHSENFKVLIKKKKLKPVYATLFYFTFFYAFIFCNYLQDLVHTVIFAF